jgi:prepilin-type N-terminal cleavage/methylation domain-containing protein/prepilin-type processing-associated H-X9-DG protein
VALIPGNGRSGWKNLLIIEKTVYIPSYFQNQSKRYIEKTKLYFDHKNKKTEYRHLSGFTLVELLVVIAIMAVLLTLLMPAMKTAKEQAMRANCLSNLHQLTLGWYEYALDNDDRLVHGDTVADPQWGNPYAWVDEGYGKFGRVESLMDGKLWPYVKTKDLYRCPISNWIKTPTVRNYSIASSMNGDILEGYDGCNGTAALIIRKISNIQQPSTRAVFIEEAFPSFSTWAICYTKEQWFDPPPVVHNNGIPLSFADGHAEYWKWEDERTIDLGERAVESPTWWIFELQKYNPDIRKMMRAVWGRLGFED